MAPAFDEATESRLSPPVPGRFDEAPRATVKSGLWSTLGIFAVASVGLSPLIGSGLSPLCGMAAGWAWFRTRSKSLRLFMKTHEHLDEGRLDAARACLAELAGRQDGQSRYLGLVGQAYVDLRAGDLDEAFAGYSAVVRVPDRMTVLRWWADAHAAVAALSGRDEDAVFWLERPAQTDAVMTASRAISLARLGRHDRVLRLRMTKPTVVQLSFAKRHEESAFRLVRAFSLHATGADSSEVDDALVGTAPRWDGEYAYLTNHWTDLAGFVRENRNRMAPGDSQLPEARVVSGPPAT